MGGQSDCALGSPAVTARGCNWARMECSFARSSVKSDWVWLDTVNTATRSIGVSEESMYRPAAFRACIKSWMVRRGSSNTSPTKREGVTKGAGDPLRLAEAESGPAARLESEANASTVKFEMIWA